MRVCRVLYACMPHASAPCTTASPHVPAVLLVAQCTPGTREAHSRKEARRLAGCRRKEKASSCFKAPRWVHARASDGVWRSRRGCGALCSLLYVLWRTGGYDKSVKCWDIGASRTSARWPALSSILLPALCLPLGHSALETLRCLQAAWRSAKVCVRLGLGSHTHVRAVLCGAGDAGRGTRGLQLRGGRLGAGGCVSCCRPQPLLGRLEPIQCLSPRPARQLARHGLALRPRLASSLTPLASHSGLSTLRRCSDASARPCHMYAGTPCGGSTCEPARLRRLAAHSLWRATRLLVTRLVGALVSACAAAVE